MSRVLFCDGGHNKHTGSVAYACVVDGDGVDMLLDNVLHLEGKVVDLPVGRRRVLISDFNDVKKQQNNGAELLGMYAALQIALSKGYDCIKCDSQLIVDYWSKKIKPSPNMDERKLMIIKEVIGMRKKFEKRGGTIVKISGKDNLADLGYHR